MTPAGIETATFRFVAQHLNHCATAVPDIAFCVVKIILRGVINHFLSFIYSPTDALVNCLKNSIKIYISTAPTYFGAVTPSSGRALICAY